MVERVVQIDFSYLFLKRPSVIKGIGSCIHNAHDDWTFREIEYTASAVEPEPPILDYIATHELAFQVISNGTGVNVRKNITIAIHPTTFLGIVNWWSFHVGGWLKPMSRDRMNAQSSQPDHDQCRRRGGINNTASGLTRLSSSSTKDGKPRSTINIRNDLAAFS